MLAIKEYDDYLNSNGREYNAATFNGTIFGAYLRSKGAGNEMLNFEWCFDEDEIRQIAKLLKQSAITEFTLSSTSTALLETLASFDKQGIKIQGFVTVNEFERPQKKIPAILMKIE